MDPTRHLQRTLQYDANDLKRFFNEGVKDGQKNIPSQSDDEVSSGELNLIINEKTNWQKYISDFQDDLSETENQINQKKFKLDNELNTKLENINSDKSNAIDKLDNMMGKNSPKYQLLLKIQNGKQDILSSIQSLVNRPLETQFASFYIPFLALLMVAEVPVNRLAFELVFVADVIYAIILALAIGGLLVFFAHIIGSALKSTRCLERNPPTILIYFVVTGIIILCGVLIYFLAKMRQQYTEVAEGGEGIDLSGLAEIIDSAETVASTALGNEGYGLLFVNIAILACGAVAAFVRHDSHPNYERAVKEFEKAQKNLFILNNDFVKKKNELETSFEEKRSQINNDKNNTEVEKDKLEKKISNLMDAKKKDYQTFIAAVERIVSHYRQGNKSVRIEKAPKFWNKKIKSILNEEIPE